MCVRGGKGEREEERLGGEYSYKKEKVRTHRRVLTILRTSRLVNKMSLQGMVRDRLTGEKVRCGEV